MIDPAKWLAEARATVAALINRELAKRCDQCGQRMENLPFCKEPRCPAVGVYDDVERAALRVVGLTKAEYLGRANVARH